MRKKKDETANPQNNTFASSDTQADASACKRVVFLQAEASEKNRPPRHILADLNNNFDKTRKAENFIE